MIYYRCDKGLIPEIRVMAVCGSDGRWVPNPSIHHCGNAISGKQKITLDY